MDGGRRPYRAKAPVTRGKSRIIHSSDIPRVFSRNCNNNVPVDTSVPPVQTTTPLSDTPIPIQTTPTTATKSSHGSVSTAHIQQNPSPHLSLSHAHHTSTSTPVSQQSGYHFIPTPGLFITDQIAVGNLEPSIEVADEEIRSDDEVDHDLDDEADHNLQDAPQRPSFPVTQVQHPLDDQGRVIIKPMGKG